MKESKADIEYLKWEKEAHEAYCKEFGVISLDKFRTMAIYTMPPKISAMIQAAAHYGQIVQNMSYDDNGIPHATREEAVARLAKSTLYIPPEGDPLRDAIIERMKFDITVGMLVLIYTGMTTGNRTWCLIKSRKDLDEYIADPASFEDKTN